jgi:hypothetical protein
MGYQRLYAAIERERARCRIHDFPASGLCHTPQPTVPRHIGPRVGVPARFTAAARFTKRT